MAQRMLGGVYETEKENLRDGGEEDTGYYRWGQAKEGRGKSRIELPRFKQQEISALVCSQREPPCKR